MPNNVKNVRIYSNMAKDVTIRCTGDIPSMLQGLIFTLTGSKMSFFQKSFFFASFLIKNDKWMHLLGRLVDFQLIFALS